MKFEYFWKTLGIILLLVLAIRIGDEGFSMLNAPSDAKVLGGLVLIFVALSAVVYFGWKYGKFIEKEFEASRNKKLEQEKNKEK